MFVIQMNDLVIVHPMSSMSGYINYIEYQFASKKGQTNQGDLIANPWQVGWDQGKTHTDFTGAAVVENVADASQAYTLAWDKAVKGAFKDTDGNAKDVKIIAANGTVTFADLDSTGKVPASALSANCRVAYV